MIHLICPNPALDRTIIVDQLKKEIPNRPKEVRDFPGGKSFNVAYALRERGQSDYCIHTILGGPIGDYIQALNTERQSPLVLTQHDRNTRICTIYLEEATGQVVLVYEKGLELTESLLTAFTDRLKESLSPGDFVVFSGSLMAGMPDDYIRRFIDEHPEVHTIVDTSGAALVQAYQAQPSLIKINNEELKDIYPDLDEQDPIAIENLLRHQVPHENLIVTLGSKGSLAKIGKHIFRVQSPKKITRNPIASGDFYLGVLVKGLVQNEAPEIYLAEAAAFATANCLNDFPEVHPHQFLSVLQEVVVEELANPS
ncbi:TPA: tagatose-6-phosphate kinase [Streptococcus suis]|nr:tagatose-6-phosphate kinase [Streptococcus suis]